MQRQTRGLVLMPGMQTLEQWDRMTEGERQTWLAGLTDLGIRGQASIIVAHDARRTVADVLASWVARGLLGRARADAVLATTPNATRGGDE